MARLLILGAVLKGTARGFGDTGVGVRLFRVAHGLRIKPGLLTDLGTVARHVALVVRSNYRPQKLLQFVNLKF